MGLFTDIADAIGSRLDAYRSGRDYTTGSATSPSRPLPTVAQGWSNVQTGQGYAATDKGASSYFAQPVTLSEHEIVQLYEGDGLAARIIDLPAQEAVRQGVRVVTDDATLADEIDDWMASLEYADGHHGLLQALERWERWRDLFGGSALVLITDEPDTRKPLRPGERLTRVRCLSRHQLQHTDLRGGDPMSGEPAHWQLVGSARVFHRSRLIFNGRGEMPVHLRQRQGWSVPAYVQCWQALVGCGTVDSAVPTIMSMFLTPVQSVKGFAKLLREGKIADVFALLGHEQLMQSMHKVRVIDADGEDYKIQTTSVAGLAEIMDRMPERVAAARGIPLTLLQGRSPGGLNATGESDARFFYDSIKAKIQEGRMTPALRRVLDVAFADASGPTGGKIPQRYKIEWAPLYQEDAAQTAARRQVLVETYARAIESGTVLPAEATLMLEDAGVFVRDDEARAIAAEQGASGLTSLDILQQTRLALDALHTPATAPRLAEIIGVPVPDQAQIDAYWLRVKGGAPPAAL